MTSVTCKSTVHSILFFYILLSFTFLLFKNSSFILDQTWNQVLFLRLFIFPKFLPKIIDKDNSALHFLLLDPFLKTQYLKIL